MMWTKTEQSLPKKPGEYLVATMNNAGQKQYRTLKFDGDRFVTNDGRPWMGVVQWMEIPGDDEVKHNYKKILIGCAIIMAFVIASCLAGA